MAASEGPPAVDARVVARKLECSEFVRFMSRRFTVQRNGFHAAQTNAKQLRIYIGTREIRRDVPKQHRNTIDPFSKHRGALLSIEKCHQSLEEITIGVKAVHYRVPLRRAWKKIAV